MLCSGTHLAIAYNLLLQRLQTLAYKLHTSTNIILTNITTMADNFNYMMVNACEQFNWQWFS